MRPPSSCGGRHSHKHRRRAVFRWMSVCVCTVQCMKRLSAVRLRIISIIVLLYVLYIRIFILHMSPFMCLYIGLSQSPSHEHVPVSNVRFVCVGVYFSAAATSHWGHGAPAPSTRKQIVYRIIRNTLRTSKSSSNVFVSVYTVHGVHMWTRVGFSPCGVCCVVSV